MIVTLSSCPNPLQATLALVVKDYSTPKTIASAQNGNGIAPTTPLVVTFSETMDTGTLTLGGTMAAESDGGKWTSSSANTSDTLTVSPASTWSVGSGKSLVVNCKDLQGYPATPIVITLGVLNGVVYVRASDGNDTNPGTPDLPKKTITSAISLAALYYTTAEVHVAEGLYDVSYTAGTHVVMVPGISLFGGYDQVNWSNRNPASHISKIKDTSSVTAPSKGRAVDCGTNCTSATLLDGFTIEGGSGSVSFGVYCDGSNPTISNNIVNGGLGSNSVGVRVSNSSAVVQNNSIDGGIGGSANDSSSVGIFTYVGTSLIKDNTISGGGCGKSAYGILNSQSTPRIEHNTITGAVGMPYIACGIYNDAAGAVIVRNSIDGGGTAYSAVTGVDCASASAAKIYDNTIHAGIGATGQVVVSMGISTESSNAVIQGNTIDCGNPGGGKDASNHSYAYGINVSSCAPTIDDNIIFCAGAVTQQDQYGVFEAGTGSTPAHFYNNDVYNCSTALYCQYSPYTKHQNFTVLNNTTWAEACVSVDPVFVLMPWPSPDWHLQASSTVKAAGLALTGTDLAVDKDGTSRTISWSIGAYEKD